MKTRDTIATYAIKLGLSRLPDFGENDHCLNKSHERISRCFEAGLKERPAHVRAQVVSYPFLLLYSDEVFGKADL